MIFLIITYLYKPINDRKDQNGKCIELSVPLCYNDWQSKYRGKQPMDQVKIGKFIAERRKKKNFTQMQLAEKLGITDRAVSKWETGKAMPDSAIMLELCDTLDITVNDLLNGEIVSAEQYNEKLEQQLMEIIAEKEISDKRSLSLFRIYMIISFILTTILFVVFLVLDSHDPGKYAWLLLVVSMSELFAFFFDLYALRMARNVGYFQCPHCKHTYTPATWRFAFARGTLYKLRMCCPECKQKDWHPRVYTKNTKHPR